MSAGTLHGLWSLLILVIFLGIVAWAWSGKRKKYFEDAGRIPFDHDDDGDPHRNGTST